MWFENFFKSIFSYGSRALVWVFGAFWGLIQPTIPFAAICFFAILLDCFTAWRLSRRVKKKHPEASDGKFKSSYARRMFVTLFIVYACTFLAFLIDEYIYPFVDLYLANWISGGFCLVQLLSVLENESSENDHHWAKVLQKVLVDKAARHFDIDPEHLQPGKQQPENADEAAAGEEEP